MSYFSRNGSVASSVEKTIVYEDRTCTPIQDEKLHQGKVLQLTRFHFEDADGNKRSSEGIKMVKSVQNGSTGKPSCHMEGGLCTIAILRRQIMCDCLVLAKQYRAPLKAYTLEFPATVANSEETEGESASKEITDDTGYGATNVKYISPLTSLDPDLSAGKIKLVSILIDGDDPIRNAFPKNNTDNNDGNGKGGHGDIVEVLQVPINGLLDRLQDYSDQGIIIDSRVYAFAIGLKKGEKLVQNQLQEQAETPI